MAKSPTEMATEVQRIQSLSEIEKRVLPLHRQSVAQLIKDVNGARVLRIAQQSAQYPSLVDKGAPTTLGCKPNSGNGF